MRYVVESVHLIGSDLVLMIVDQTYTDADGQPRDERPDTHTFVVSMAAEPRILAGQNTVQVAD